MNPLFKRKLSRRGMVAMAAASAARPLLAQDATAQPNTAPLMQAQKTRFENSARQLDGVKLPRQVEPALRFEA